MIFLYYESNDYQVISYYWLWYGGVGLISAGVAYVAYKFFTDPAFIGDLVGPGAPRGTGTVVHGRGPKLTVTDTDGITAPVASGSNIGFFTLALGRKIINLPNNVLSALNPLNYITSARDHDLQHANFLERQRSVNIQNRTLFPFTENNPFDPWYKKLRIYFFSETAQETKDRREILPLFDSAYEDIKVRRRKYSFVSGTTTPGSGMSTPGSGKTTPGSSILGLDTDQPFFEQVVSVNRGWPVARVLELKLSELDSLREQAAVKTKSHKLPIPSAF